MLGKIQAAFEDGQRRGESLVADERGQTGPANRAVQIVVGLVVGALMAAFLLPIAIDELEAVDTSSWSDGAAAMWDVLPILVVLAIFLFFVTVAVRRS